MNFSIRLWPTRWRFTWFTVTRRDCWAWYRAPGIVSAGPVTVAVARPKREAKKVTSDV